jgi:hypothetical protein
LRQSPNTDEDKGFSDLSPVGDGFTVFDEYRGFHYVEDDGTTVRWTSTDPMTTQDVFFLDTTTDSRFTTALRSILDKRTTFVKYRRVSGDQANPRSVDLTAGVNQLNINNPDAATGIAYALVYVDDESVAGAGVCGVLATSGGFVSDGTPIRIADAHLTACAAAKDSFPGDVLTAGVLAHETGHKFDLNHYSNDQILAAPLTNPDALTFSQYLLQAPTNPAANSSTLGRFYTYTNSSDKLQTGDRINKALFDVAGNSTVGPPVLIGTAGAESSIIRYNWMILITPTDRRIRVDRQELFLMDFNPRLDQMQPVPAGTRNLRDNAGWVFKSDAANAHSDLNLLTVKVHL